MLQFDWMAAAVEAVLMVGCNHMQVQLLNTILDYGILRLAYR